MPPSLPYLGPQFEILSVLGRGGMATVYLANWKSDHGVVKQVALKVPLPHILENQNLRALFIEEAKLAAKLHHPSISEIFGLTQFNEVPIIIMEYIKGDSLKSLFDKSIADPITISASLSLLRQIAEALDYAHSFEDPQDHKPKRILHRDLTPHNIMITGEGRAVILDFGVAKILEHENSNTRTESLKGKLGYLAPEILSGEPFAESSDLFSLGVVIYELLTAERLFKGRNESETIEKTKSLEIIPITEINSKIPESFSNLLNRLLERNSRVRFKTAKELLIQLNEPRLRNLAEKQSLANWFEKIKIGDSTQTSTKSDFRDSNKIRQRYQMRRRLKWTLGAIATLAMISTFQKYIFSNSVKLGFKKIGLSKNDGEQLQIIWKNGNKVHDLSAPKLDYKPTWANSPESISSVGCAEFCPIMGHQSNTFFDLPGTRRILKNGSKKPAQLFREYSNFLKLRNSKLEFAWKGCELTLTQYCRVSHAISMFSANRMELTNLKDSDSIETIHQKFTQLIAPNPSKQILDLFFKGVSPDLNTLMKPFLKQLESGRKYPTSSIEFPFELFVIKGADKLNTNTSCELLGDLLYVRRMLEVPMPENPTDYSVIILNSGTSMQILATTKAELRVDFLDGIKDSIFQDGICIYSRVGGLLKNVHYWVPKIDT